MLTILITFSVLFVVPTLLVFVMQINQKADYRKNKKRNESYTDLCKRSYTRFV